MGINGATETKPGKVGLSGKDRLIVALDVPDHKEAIQLVRKLDNVFFFKIGLELILCGNLVELIKELHKKRADGGIFLDLKLAFDIPQTITNFIKICTDLRIKFITITGPSEFVLKSRVIQTAGDARGGSENPKIIGVPLVSSMRIDETTLSGASNDTDYILQRGGDLIEAGCDGLIVSGNPIQHCRNKFDDVIIVSPGIRPSGASTDDHVRFTTPSQAIELGADYLVVGRPILNAPNKKEAAQKIIDEIDEALELRLSSVLT